MTSDQIVSALLAAARSAVTATLGERAEVVWPMIEGEARQAAEESASELAALLEAPEPKKEEPIDPKNTPKVREAIEAAMGRREIPEEGFRIVGAKKDLNARGRGTEFYRMVRRDNRWQYVSTERLPTGSFRASDRRATVYGEVYPGEIVASHDRGGPLDIAWLAVGEGHGPGSPEGNSWGIGIEIKKLRSGLLRFLLPDGQTIDLPNPRT